MEHTVKNRCGINNIKKHIKLQASSKELFILQQFWLLLENGCMSEDAAILQDNNTSYAVVYSVDSNVQSFQHQIYVQSVKAREHGPVQVKNSRRL